jgi:hypothetical protein
MPMFQDMGYLLGSSNPLSGEAQAVPGLVGWWACARPSTRA